MAARQQHRYDIVATNLLFACFIIGVVVDLYTRKGVFNFQSKIISQQAFLVIVIISLLFSLAHYYFIRQGYRWAKILFFIFFTFSVVFLIADYKGVAAKQFVSPLKTANYFLQCLLQLIATGLLIMSYKNTKWQAEQPLPTLEE